MATQNAPKRGYEEDEHQAEREEVDDLDSRRPVGALQEVAEQYLFNRLDVDLDARDHRR